MPSPASNVGSKLKGLEITRNRVKELRDRLMAFEEVRLNTFFELRTLDHFLDHF